MSASNRSEVTSDNAAEHLLALEGCCKAFIGTIGGPLAELGIRLNIEIRAASSDDLLAGAPYTAVCKVCGTTTMGAIVLEDEIITVDAGDTLASCDEVEVFLLSTVDRMLEWRRSPAGR